MLAAISSMYSELTRTNSVEFCGNRDGFSGAQIWKVSSADGEWCVRRWPKSHPSMEQLRWIHDVLSKTRQHGCHFIPAPRPNRAGDTILAHDGYLWEVAPWLPGAADLRTQFSEERLRAACVALAEFHLAASHTGNKVCVSPGMRERHAMAVRALERLPEYQAAVERSPMGATRELCLEILELARPQLQYLPSQLQSVVDQVTPLQPCIRDIWHQHVLFEQGRLTGIVDFGAMRIESVTLDLARLLGSLEVCSPEVWQVGIAAYSGTRPLSPAEGLVLKVASQSSAPLAGLNWVRWLTMEARMFEKMDLVHARLQDILGQLRLRSIFFSE